jgi:hypothetical protein
LSAEELQDPEITDRDLLIAFNKSKRRNSSLETEILRRGIVTRDEMQRAKDFDLRRGDPYLMALIMFGEPSRTNIYNSGRELQLVWGSMIFVHVDSSGRVTNWQTLGL